MQLSLKITSYQRLTPGQDEVFRPATESFTIGRNHENDWSIPDPQRFLSGSHCRIHCEGGQHFITDTSTNGVFLNGSDTRLQRNETIALSHGDRFRIGDYEFEVLIEDPALAGNPLTGEDETSVGSDPFEESDPFPEPVAFPESDAFSEPDPFEESDPFAEADPFAEPDASEEANPFDTPATGQDGLQKDLNAPLAQMDGGPLGSHVNIDSLMDLDDDDDLEEDIQSAESLEQRQSPLNEAFSPSSHATPSAADYALPGDEAGVPSNIPDDWDEATGMLRIPEPGTETPPSGPLEIPDDWDEATGMLKVPVEKPLPEAAPPQPAAPPKAPPQAPAPATAPAPAPATAPPAAPAPAAAPLAASAGSDATAAFARGAGLELSKIAKIDQQVLFEQVGRMLAMFTKGLIQALGGRSEIKSEFRIEQTMIRPADNNPFKFSTSEALTMLQLLSKSDPAYMSGANAISEGFDDINAHQMAVIAGMEAALQDILNRFNPKNLETRMVSGSILDSILPGGKKARYWDVFKLLFDEIAGEAEDDFQKQFGREFSRAYEEQLSRLKNTR